MTVSTLNYLEFATAACEAEQKRYWEKACKLWQSAAEVAKKSCNQHWAQVRAEFCASRKPD